MRISPHEKDKDMSGIGFDVKIYHHNNTRIHSVKGKQMQDIPTSIKWMIHERSHMRNIYANIIVPRLRNNYLRLTEK